MPRDVVKGKNTPIKMWAPTHEVESQALDQLKNIASLPWIAHLAVMPDVHFGIGATVGSVIAMRGAVCPAAVGVDIGCGMAAVRTNLTASDLPNNLKKWREALEVAIPVGSDDHQERTNAVRNDVELVTRNAIDELMGGFGKLTGKVKDLQGRALRQLGTLGGGNHFIELCLDTGKCSGFKYGEGTKMFLRCYDGKYMDGTQCGDCGGLGEYEPRVWLMLHSGSRNIGKSLAEHHMGLAKKLQHNDALVDRNLASFLTGTPEMTAYRNDLYWAQNYARTNRMIMLDLYKGIVRSFKPSVKFNQGIHCHHNYVAEENHFGEDLFVTRKGAIRAGKGELGIIPGSMGTKSFIVSGLGCAEALDSASHGAGRRMSRTKAKEKYTIADLEKATAGVECRKDSGVIDEIPMAYKSIDQVMQNQHDLVEVIAEIKQVLCVKG